LIHLIIGLAAATAGGVLGEFHDSRHSHPRRFSVLDAAATSLGGGVGALATDKWILAPVVKSANGSRYYGLASRYEF
jgi:hypothetical protein